MNAQLIQGRSFAVQIQQEIKQKVEQRCFAGGRAPGLAVIIVGDHPASRLYVARKQAAAQAVGIQVRLIELSAQVSEIHLLEIIQTLNHDPLIDGILVQLPLPDHISMYAVIDQIAPHKDVDGFHPINVGLLAQNRALLRPCTPKGVMRLLQKIGVALEGLHSVVIGTSHIVGRPMGMELLHAGSTVTFCHRRTHHLSVHTQQADVLITAAGCPHLIQAHHVKPGAIVIDIGINRLANGSIMGDVDFSAVAPLATWITPVPGGVGPMTVAMLLENTWIASNKIPDEL